MIYDFKCQVYWLHKLNSEVTQYIPVHTVSVKKGLVAVLSSH